MKYVFIITLLWLPVGTALVLSEIDDMNAPAEDQEEDVTEDQQDAGQHLDPVENILCKPWPSYPSLSPEC